MFSLFRCFFPSNAFEAQTCVAMMIVSEPFDKSWQSKFGDDDCESEPPHSPWRFNTGDDDFFPEPVDKDLRHKYGDDDI